MNFSEALQFAALAVPMGFAGVAMAVAFRWGRLRRLAWRYWDSGYPWYIRNVAFMMGPAGVAFLLPVPAGFLYESGDLLPSIASLILSCLALVAFLVGVLWARNPPGFLKPMWLRTQERTLGLPPIAVGAARWIDRAAVLIAITVTAIALGGVPILVLLGSN